MVMDFGVDSPYTLPGSDIWGSSSISVGLPDGREISCVTDRYEVDSAGSLHVVRPDGTLCLSLASGSWTHAYLSSVLDWSPVVVSYLPKPKKS